MKLPQDFEFAGVACGIKHDPQKKDVALILSRRAAVGAGVYTQNIVVAAPVVLDRQRTPAADIRAVVVNSGNANACTGQRGMQDAQAMSRQTADLCGLSAKQVLVMSTGIIGEFLPMEKITSGITAARADLAPASKGFLNASQAILTSDRGPKTAERSLSLGGRSIQLSAMAKGAGMIGPNMATMLAVITTDAALTVDDAQRLLQTAADKSFNCISVEGHTSTNDSMVLLANGAAGGEPLAGEELTIFQASLEALCIELAKMIPDDGEGASHLIEIEVLGCRTIRGARQIAKCVAQSALVKTAVTGCDPNWGRIVSAAGYAGVDFAADEVALSVNGFSLYQDGAPAAFDAAAVSDSMRQHRETKIKLTVGSGPASALHWTSDLTVDYVRFNSEYHT